MEFPVDDWVFLKVAPMKGVMSFCKKVKLNPKHVGLYNMLKIFGKVDFSHFVIEEVFG